MPKARVKLPPDLAGLLASDWERVLSEALLGAEDTKIVRLYVLQQLPQIDVGQELSMDRSTVSRRMEKIIVKVRATARRLDLL